MSRAIASQHNSAKGKLGTKRSDACKARVGPFADEIGWKLIWLSVDSPRGLLAMVVLAERRALGACLLSTEVRWDCSTTVSTDLAAGFLSLIHI